MLLYSVSVMNFISQIVRRIPQAPSLVSNIVKNKPLLDVSTFLSNRLSCLTIQGKIFLTFACINKLLCFNER